ncbi:hypothetical protein G7Y79_00030g064850 [Physcia stellaris]|nr:hypothetical protein G7Y79_00030g064850 [Physcia stellaris]
MMSIALSMMVFTAALLPHASANTRMPGRMFWEDSREVVRAAAPMWHFGRPGGSVRFLPILQKVLALLTPYLEIMLPVRGSPRQWQKPNGAASDNGVLGALKTGCAKQGDWKGENTPGNYMPTYYTQNFCTNDNSWRITYYLYFSHDSGHRYDWEWVSVIWKKDNNDEDNWYRAAIKTSFHKTSKMSDWGKIQNTINGWDDRFDQNAKDRDHAKVYVGSFHHAMFLDRYTTFGTLGADELEFRSDDWYYLPLWDNDLIDGLTLPDFTYKGDLVGQEAASTPHHMHDSDKICNDRK